VLKSGHAASKTWKFIYQLVATLGAMACVLVWLGIKPEDVQRWHVALNLPHWFWLLASICLFAFSILSSLRSFRLPPRAVKDERIERQFFICSNGYPLRGLQSAIQLDLQILSTVQTKIVYAKVTLSRSEGYQGKASWIDIENYEPHILMPMQMFNLPMTKQDMQQEDVSRFLGPNTSIRGFIKVEKGDDYEEIQIPPLATHRECPEDPNVPQLRARLHEAQTTLAESCKPPDDLHVELLCFIKGFTLRINETFYFLKLKVSCDEDTGIKGIKVLATIGSDAFLMQPMNDLSGWRVQTPFTSTEYPYKSFTRQSMPKVSLWDDLQRNGLKSGLVKEGWIGIYFSERKEDVSRIELQITKSKQREPASFTFATFPKEEDVHVNDYPDEI
jgi:hypothetical protein